MEDEIRNIFENNLTSKITPYKKIESENIKRGNAFRRFVKTKHNQILTDLFKAIPDNKQIKLIDEQSTVATVEYNNKSRRFTFSVMDYNSLSTVLSKTLYEEGKANQSVSKLIKHVIFKIINEQIEDGLVIIPLKEYQEILGKSDIKDLRERTNIDLELFKRFEIKLETKGKTKKFLHLSLYGGTAEIEKGCIRIRLNTDFERLINSMKQTILDDRKVLKISEQKHRHALLLWEKIKDHKVKNIGKPNEDIISVKTLYEYCITLPRYEKLNDKSQWRQLILTPFNKDMLELVEYLETFEWEYKGNGEFSSWEDFLNTNIQLKFKVDLMKHLRETKANARKRAKENKK